MKKIISFLVGALCLLTVFGCENNDSYNGQLSLRKVKMDKYVTLGQYKGLEVTKQAVEISEDDIQEKMLAIVGLNLSEVGIKDRPAKKGDRIVANFNCYIDGVAVTSASSSGEKFVIGDGTMIEDIEEAFDGMSVGDVKNIEVVYPDDYSDLSFAGKTATLRLELVSIYPEKITDSMVASLDSLQYKTVDELHAYCENLLRTSAESSLDSQVLNELLAQAYKNAEFKELPEKYLEEEKQIIRSNFEYTAGLYGLTSDEYVQFVYEVSVDQMAEKYLKQRMLIEAIAQKEGVSYTDKSYNEEITKAAESQGLTVDTYFLLNNITNNETYIEKLTSDKVSEIILNSAVITEE